MVRRPLPPTLPRWVALFCVLPLLGFWLAPVWDLDEGFYSAIAREMARRGEWLTPFYNGESWFEKPILLYWAALPGVHLWPSEFMLRLPSVLAFLATCHFLYRWAGSVYGHTTGVLAALVYGTSLLPILMGRLMTPDALFVFALTASLASFSESLGVRPRRRLLSGAWLGLAVLAKGPVALILFAAIVGVSFWREETLRHKFRGYWSWFWVAFVVVVAAWYVPCYLVNGQKFIQEFLIEQNINRFLGGDEAHKTQWWMTFIYYPLILLVGMFPWSLMAPKAWRIVNTDATTRFIVRWAVLIFVFFSLSQSKLPHYILPVIPPLAVLVARYLHVVKEVALNPGPLLRTGAILSVGVCLFVNWGMATWARLGYQDEVRADARILVREVAPEERIVLFQLPRQDGSPPKMQVQVQQTSLPSILFYLNRTAVMTDEMEPVFGAEAPDTFYLFTRSNRLEGVDAAVLEQWERERLDPNRDGAYELYRFRRIRG